MAEIVALHISLNTIYCIYLVRDNLQFIKSMNEYGDPEN